MYSENLTLGIDLSPPTNLCFNCNEFTKDTFSVDRFLQEHRNMDNLEIMRDDLGIYLKTLRQSMLEMINKDYADFVNLSSNLIGLDKAIMSIQLPLGQLKEELLVVQHNIEDALNEVSVLLLRRKQIEKKKQSLKNLNKVHLSLKKLSTLLHEISEQQTSTNKILQLERAAMEFNQLQFQVSKCKNYLSNSDQQCLEDIRRDMHKYLENQFVECQTDTDDDQLLRVLCIYLALDKCSQAEQSYRKEKISPIIQNLINEEALASNPRGLKGLYDSLIEFLDNDMKTLQSTTLTSEKLGMVKGFDFVVNSYWPEVEERLQFNLASIYAPGNPDNFFLCYNETLQFIKKLERRCNKKALKDHPQYQSFMLRWNLPVYFQIRFQEIAGSVEKALTDPQFNTLSSDWKLTATKIVWENLLRCWANKVFITQLTHRFWKLNVQIISRYIKWSKDLLEKKSGDDGLKSEVWVYLHTDLTTLSQRLGELLIQMSQHLHCRIFQKMRDHLQKCIDEWKEKLVAQLDAVSARLVHEVSVQSVAALRQVSEVPRLYRRTNREAPTRSLPYVDAMLDVPLNFHSHHKNHPHILLWLQKIFTELTRQYYVAVMDVLTSVQKTEESLRRLKKIRDRSMVTGSTSDRGGDDDKIRMQLYYDANYYCNKIEEAGIRKENIEQLTDLLKLVETLHNRNGFTK